MGLPANDPLRFDRDGRLLTREELDARLGSIIESWDTWKWGQQHKPEPPPPKEEGSWLSRREEPQGRGRTEQRWLSRRE